MKPLEYCFSLDFQKENSQVFCQVRNGDDCSKLIVSLREDGEAYMFDSDVHVFFLAKKSDGNSLYTECSVVNNTIVYEFTEQTAPVSGSVICQFLLLSGSNRLTTPMFRLEVSDNVSIDPDSPQSLPEYTALIDATQDAIDATDDMRDLIDEIEYKLAHGEFKGEQGEQGEQGNPGADGFSPTATVTKSGHVATITITDKSGTTTAQISDGEVGMDLAPRNPTAQKIEDMPDGQLYSDTVNHKGIIKGAQQFYDTFYLDVKFNQTPKITYNNGNPSTSDANFKRGDIWVNEAGDVWTVVWVNQNVGGIRWERITRHGTQGRDAPPATVFVASGKLPAYKEGDLYIKRGSSWNVIEKVYMLSDLTISGTTCTLTWLDISSLVDLSDYYNKTEIDNMIGDIETLLSEV